MAKPDLIKWVSGDEAAKITDPGATKKLAGFLYKEKPPFQYFNWLFNRLSKWLLGMQGSYFDIVIGSSTQVTNLEATHVLSDLDDTLVTAGTKVLILNGTHTLLANFSLANDSIKIIGESVNAIIDVSTFTFTLGGNNVDAELKFINSGAGDIILSGIGSFLKTYDVTAANLYVANGSNAVSTGTLGGIKNKNYYGLDPNGDININTLGSGKVFINGKQQGFRGALVYISSTFNSVNDVPTIVNWDSEEYDTDNLHSTSVDTSRLTVPTGVTKVILKANIRWDASTTGSRIFFAIKNGSNFKGMIYVNNETSSTGDQASNGATSVLDVIAGDYFEVTVIQYSGGDLTLDSVNSGTWFAMEIIE